MTPDGNIDHAATEKYTEQEQWARHEHFKRLRANRMGRLPTEFATLPDFILGFSQTAAAASKAASGASEAASGASEGASAAEVPPTLQHSLRLWKRLMTGQAQRSERNLSRGSRI